MLPYQNPQKLLTNGYDSKIFGSIENENDYVNSNNNFIQNIAKPNSNFIIKSIQNKKSLKMSNSTSTNLTYLNLITQLLQQSKLNSNINYGILIRCLFDKFKETIDVSYKSNTININSNINDKNFKVIFLDNFEHSKSNRSMSKF